MKHSFFVLLLFLTITSTFSQSSSDKQFVKKLMNQAKKEMKAENYDAANRTFRKLLNSHKILPDELSYLFAETLYMIGQYENSHNFLDKYKKLTQKAGDYYEQSIQLDELLDDKLKEIVMCRICDKKGYTLRVCHNCNGSGHTIENCNYCKGTGISSCMVCLGEGVIITATEFDNKSYKTCLNCQAKGHVACPVCEGSRQIDNSCSVCLGTGKESTKSICLHPDL